MEKKPGYIQHQFVYKQLNWIKFTFVFGVSHPFSEEKYVSNRNIYLYSASPVLHVPVVFLIVHRI